MAGGWFTQNGFNKGEVSPSLAARTGSENQLFGVQKAENAMVHSDGSIGLRWGTRRRFQLPTPVVDRTTKTRAFPYVHDGKKFVIQFVLGTDKRVYVHNERSTGVWYDNVSSTIPDRQPLAVFSTTVDFLPSVPNLGANDRADSLPHLFEDADLETMEGHQHYDALYVTAPGKPPFMLRRRIDNSGAEEWDWDPVWPSNRALPEIKSFRTMNPAIVVTGLIGQARNFSSDIPLFERVTVGDEMYFRFGDVATSTGTIIGQFFRVDAVINSKEASGFDVGLTTAVEGLESQHFAGMYKKVVTENNTQWTIPVMTSGATSNINFTTVDWMNESLVGSLVRWEETPGGVKRLAYFEGITTTNTLGFRNMGPNILAVTPATVEIFVPMKYGEAAGTWGTRKRDHYVVSTFHQSARIGIGVGYRGKTLTIPEADPIPPLTVWRSATAATAGTNFADVSLFAAGGEYPLWRKSFSPGIWDYATLRNASSIGPVTNWGHSWGTGPGFPSVVLSHQGRLVLAGFKNPGNAVAISATFEPDNLNALDNTGRPQAPINLQIGKTEDEVIQWADSNVDLVLGTDEAEYSLKGSPLSAQSLGVDQHSEYGANKVKPARLGSISMFVQQGGHSLRGMQHNFESERFESTRLNQHADHILAEAGDYTASPTFTTAETVIRMATVFHPEPVTMLLTNKGRVILHTISNEGQINAFCPMAFNDSDTCEDLFVVRGNAAVHGDHDTIWAVMVRGGQRVIEAFDPSAQMDSVPDIVFEPALNITVDALHLAGRTVYLFTGDSTDPLSLPGIYWGGPKVMDSTGVIAAWTNGPNPVTVNFVGKLTQMGLKIDMEVQLNPIDIVTGGGSTAGKLKALPAAKIYVIKSMGGTIGSANIESAARGEAVSEKTQWHMVPATQDYGRNPGLSIKSTVPGGRFRFSVITVQTSIEG